MHILIKGVSHKTAPLIIRERFSLSSHKARKKILFFLREQEAIDSAFILSTCNRTEIYILAEDKAVGKKVLDKSFFPEESKGHLAQNIFYELEDEEASRHLFKVGCGIDSQVLGETQIIGQIKSAWESAQKFGLSSFFLDRLIQSALIVARRVHAATDISKGNVSVSSVAIKKCREYFLDLNEKKVLILGAGKVARSMVAYLNNDHMNAIFVANRTYESAVELANRCHGEAIHFDLLLDWIKDVDIVISSTSAPHILVTQQQIKAVMGKRHQPLFIIDLGVPRDIDPSVREIKNVFLYDMDDLKSVIADNFALRLQEVKKANRIIEFHLKNFLQYWQGSMNTKCKYAVNWEENKKCLIYASRL